MQTEWIPIKHLKTNDGQIPGVPKNPRYISEGNLEKLMQSIRQCPEMLHLRELIVYPFNGQYAILCGNMRYKACSKLGHTEMPCKVVDADTTPEKLREYIVQDNHEYGKFDWDIVKTDWDVIELESFGIELPDFCVQMPGFDSDGDEEEETGEEDLPEELHETNGSEDVNHTDTGEVLDECPRPDYTSTDLDKGCGKNNMYFYVEYYDDTERFLVLREKLEGLGLIETNNRVNAEKFYAFVMQCGDK